MLKIGREKLKRLDAPIIVVKPQGQHSTAIPKDVEVPIQHLLVKHGFTKGVWELGVRGVHINGSPAHGGRVRVHDVLFSTVIDLIVQPGGLKTRRRAELLVPSEHYIAREVFDAIRPPAVVVTHFAKDFRVDSQGVVTIDQHPLARSVVRKTARTNQTIRLASRAATFWSEKGNLARLADLLESKVDLRLGLGTLWLRDLDQAMRKVWGEQDFEHAKHILLDSLQSEHGLLTGFVFWDNLPEKRTPLQITEEGGFWINDARERVAMRNAETRAARVADLHVRLSKVAERKKATEQQFKRRMEVLVSEESDLRTELARLSGMC